MTSVRYVSVCSGIEAATTAWHPLGWEPQWFSEIEPFPSRVLAHHYPEVENRGDFTKAYRDGETCDLLVGGTPCQSFSVAGQRAGLDDPRGVLAVEFARLARRLRARWLVWENVPGVLSHDGGNTFGEILRVLAECGYGFAYRVLDAQGFGVPQRRRRVFLVGYLGDWRPPAAVLFERESLRRDPPSRREAGTEIASTLTRCADRSSNGDDTLIAACLVASGDHLDPSMETTFVTAFHAQQDPISGTVRPCLSKQAGEAVCFDEAQVTSAQNRSNPRPGDPAPSLSATGRPTVAYGTWAIRGRAGEQEIEFSEPVAHALRKSPGSEFSSGVVTNVVRRLTPLERERLQGFEDGYTAIPGASVGARNAALGNSMAVPCMRWIGERIALVDRVVNALADAPLTSALGVTSIL